MWQDYIITISNILFSYSLVFQVYYGFKRKTTSITITTCSLTLLGLIAMVFCFFSLKLYLSGIFAYISSLLWFLLLVQAVIYKKK